MLVRFARKFRNNSGGDGELLQNGKFRFSYLPTQKQRIAFLSFRISIPPGKQFMNTFCTNVIK